MANICRICKSSLRAQVDQKVRNQYTFNEIQTWLERNGLRVSLGSVKHHAKNHISDYEGRNPNELKEMPKKHYEPLQVNFQVSMDELGIDETEDAMTRAKKGLQGIFEKQLAITNEALNAYSQGLIKYPSEEIKGLKILLDIRGYNTDFLKIEKDVGEIPRQED